MTSKNVKIFAVTIITVAVVIIATTIKNFNKETSNSQTNDTLSSNSKANDTVSSNSQTNDTISSNSQTNNDRSITIQVIKNGDIMSRSFMKLMPPKIQIAKNSHRKKFKHLVHDHIHVKRY